MTFLIQNGRVLDPARGIDGVTDVFVRNGKIAPAAEAPESCDVIDATGFWVVPGFIDLHVHARDPGFPEKETLETCSRSAAAGGFTTICVMPNTKPVTDSADAVRYIVDKRVKDCAVNVLPIGSVTLGQKGKSLADFAAMRNAGICALSEDGKTVQDAALFEEGCKEAARLNLPMFSHCEDESLLKGGVMHEGLVSRKLGLPGISRDAEDVIIARDIEIARRCGLKLHICHVSTKRGVELIRAARASGQAVTGEACPHHFTLSDEDINGLDTNFKMNPPLRAPKDRDAVVQGILDGTLSVIATDHAPHAQADKAGGFLKAAYGIVGLETAFALANTVLVRGKGMEPSRLIAALTKNPAEVLGLGIGTLRPGEDADITLVDPNTEWVVDPSMFHSKSKNTPFGGLAVRGRVVTTIVSGRIAYDNR